MTTNAEFEHILNVIFGVDTPAQLLCFENGITNLRKFKVKFRNIRNLEYTDSTTNTKVKLSDDDYEELEAFVPFKNHLQNELGVVSKNPVDITQYSREDFLRYYDNVYDVDNPTQYDQALAQTAEKHAEEMKILAARTANAMTTTVGTTTTTNTGGGSSSGSTSGGGVTNPVDHYKAELKALKKAGVPDVKKYIELTSDDSYSTWEKKFTNTAKLQGFGNLLNPIYAPSTPEEKEVFNTRQQHLYDILNKILLTPKGRDILSNHIVDNNAQKVLIELKEHQTESVIASRRRRECLQQILNSRIDPNQNGK